MRLGRKLGLLAATLAGCFNCVARREAAPDEVPADSGFVGDASSEAFWDAGEGDQDAGTSETPDGGCIPETPQQFCERWGSSCDDTLASDNCGQTRKVNCGTCSHEWEVCVNHMCQCGYWGSPDRAALDECGRLGLHCNTVDIMVCGVPYTYSCGGRMSNYCTYGFCVDNCRCEACAPTQVCNPWSLACEYPRSTSAQPCESPLCDAACAQPDRAFHDCGMCDGQCTLSDSSTSRQVRSIAGFFVRRCWPFDYEVDERSIWRLDGGVYWSEGGYCPYNFWLSIETIGSGDSTYWYGDYDFSELLGGDTTNVYVTKGHGPGFVTLQAVSVAEHTFTELAPVNAPDFLVSDGNTVFWHDDGSFFSIPSGGGTVSTLAGTPDPITSMEIRNGQIVWTDSESVRLADASGNGSTALASGQSHPRNIRVDSAGLYWTTDDAIVSLPLGATDPATLAAGLSTPVAFDVDEVNLYWTDASDMLLKRGIAGGVTSTVAHLDAPTRIFVTSDSIVFTEMRWGPGIGEIRPK